MTSSTRWARGTKRHKSEVVSRSGRENNWRLEFPAENSELTEFNNPTHVVHEDQQEKSKIFMLFLEESSRSPEWSRKYIHSKMFLLGYGAYGSVFKVTTRLYHSKSNLDYIENIDKKRYVYHPDFLSNYASQRRLKVEEFEKLKDKHRNECLFDTVAIKYEILDQPHLEDGVSRFHLFLRREFLVLDTIWRRFPRQLIGFPVVFDFGYIGNRETYGVDSKFNSIFTYLNMQGEEVNFFADTNNRNLESITKLSYMTMEMLGPSIEDYRSYFEPWFTHSNVRPFFQARTAFIIADQLLCRLYILHRAGFVHHDLKPDNLSIGMGRAMNTIYLIDFGFAKQISDCPVHEWMGSRKYISIDTYNNEKPNYAQDIESWFYVVVSLLFDLLPWSDGVILPLLEPNAEEGAKWMLVISIKKTWWGEYSMAHTLHSTLKGMAALHQTELPDIQQIMQQLHKKVRDLRAHLRRFQDSKSLNTEVCNNHSVASKGYMSIRKVLLQIFDLPNIAKNPALGDNEFYSYQDIRKAQGLKPYTWDPNDFEWEWDKHHERMTSAHSGSIGPDDGINAMTGTFDSREDTSGTFGNVSNGAKLTETHNTASVQLQLRSLASYLDYGVRGMRTRLADATVPTRPAQPPLATHGRRERPDEVSYVYDATTNTLVPKLYSNRSRLLHQKQLQQKQRRPKSADNRAHPNCLM